MTWTQAFNSAFQYLLGNEGRAYTNDPHDSGGETKFGVTRKAYQFYTGHAVTAAEIENLTEDDAQAFYYSEFWEPLGADFLTSVSIATCLFDSAVLYGAVTVIRMAQEILDSPERGLKVDGILGEESIAALNNAGAADFINSFHRSIINRIARVVEHDSKNERYARGWTNRANRLLTLIH